MIQDGCLKNWKQENAEKRKDRRMTMLRPITWLVDEWVSKKHEQIQTIAWMRLPWIKNATLPKVAQYMSLMIKSIGDGHQSICGGWYTHSLGDPIHGGMTCNLTTVHGKPPWYGRDLLRTIACGCWGSTENTLAVVTPKPQTPYCRNVEMENRSSIE